MGYPVASVGPAVKTSAGQRAGALALAAGALYVIGYYLPIVELGGDGSSFSDGDSAAIWTWVVPGLVAAVAGVLAMTGKRLAGPVAAGVALGLAGFTVFELLVVDELASQMGDYSGLYSVDVSKGIGFWMMGLAAVLGVVAAVTLLTGLSSSGEVANSSARVPSMLGAVCFVGVPLAVLLPENGSSPFSAMPTGALKAGLLMWALLAPVLGLALVATRKASGIAAGVGVALAHCGFSLTMLFVDSSDGMGTFTTGHTAIYHWSAWASLVLLVVAAMQAAKTSPAPTAAGAVAQAAAQAAGQWAADPYGRHQYRWYDGVRWTAQVSDHGVVGHDEPVAAPAPVPRDQWQPPHQ